VVLNRTEPAKPSVPSTARFAKNLGIDAMTEDQLAMAKKLVVNAAKQGLSFSERTTMKFTDKRMVYQTAEAFLELNHPDGSKSDKFGCFGVFVSDPTKSTLIP